MTRSVLAVGDVIDARYEVTETLDDGGFSRVYRGRQLTTGQPIAIKVLVTEALESDQIEVQRARFEREMAAIARLQHPNIVRLVDTGRLPDGGDYIVLEHVPGTHLAEHIELYGPLEPPDALHVMSQVLDALGCAHSAGVVHRDLSPSNIMISVTGTRPNAQVVDFGIAGLVDSTGGSGESRLTSANTVVGTPSYMAPEQVRGDDVTPQSDIYAWGLVYIEALTGHKAVAGGSPHEIMARQYRNEPVPIPEAIGDQTLRDVLRRALAKPLDHRFESAAAVERALSDYTPRAGDVSKDPAVVGDATIQMSGTDPRIQALLAQHFATAGDEDSATDSPAAGTAAAKPADPTPPRPVEAQAAADTLKDPVQSSRLADRLRQSNPELFAVDPDADAEPRDADTADADAGTLDGGRTAAIDKSMIDKLQAEISGETPAVDLDDLTAALPAADEATRAETRSDDALATIDEIETDEALAQTVDSAAVDDVTREADGPGENDHDGARAASSAASDIPPTASVDVVDDESNGTHAEVPSPPSADGSAGSDASDASEDGPAHMDIPKTANHPAVGADAEAEPMDPESGGGAGRVILILFVLAAVAAGGYAAWRWLL